MSSKNIGRLGATIFIILVLVALGMRNRFAGSVEAQEQPADSSSSDLFSPAQSSVPEQEREPNRLIHEKSPYFLQHARNPVDWYPWVESTRLAGCTVRPDHYADAVEGV